MMKFAEPTLGHRDEARPVLFRGARIVDPAAGSDQTGDLLVVSGKIVETAAEIAPPEGTEIVTCNGAVLAPGLVDMQVHAGEPGHEHLETLASASRAAAAGGVTTMACMPCTDPPIDDPALVDFVLRRARDTAIVNVVPIAAATRGLKGAEMTEIGMLQEAGAVAVSGGRGAIANSGLMRRLLTYAGDFGVLVINAVEDAELAGSGVMNESEAATRLGLAGIPVAAETVMLDRDLRLAALTGGRYHAGQISAAESVEALRAARKRGVKVTCGVSIAHLTLNQYDIGSYRTFLKMHPPLRTEDDRLALVEALADGTIDVVISNHDPQDVDTKRQPFAEASDGAIGLETMLAASLRLYHDGSVTLPALMAAMSTRPAKLLGLSCGTLAPGSPADLVLFDPGAPWIVEAAALSSKSKNTPFEDARMQGRVLRTVVAGRAVYEYSSSGN
ncbi:dihydroorotase [Tepidamorphus sp. 3E244]|uniref:dihydroorotase n=1 Tax=Tepidamorphus sp. 3E244 TaxID=3385498 RepID=UPI0038FC6382